MNPLRSGENRMEEWGEAQGKKSLGLNLTKVHVSERRHSGK